MLALFEAKRHGRARNPAAARARDRARGGCAIWRRRSPSASRRARGHAFRRRTAADQRQFALRPRSRRRGRDVAFGVDSGAGRRERRTSPLADGRDAPPPRSLRRRLAAGPPPPNSRFLWTLDEEGRFGAAASHARRGGRRQRAAPRRVPSRPCSAAPNSKAAASSSAPLPGRRRSPGSSSAGRSRAWTAAAWSRFRLRRCSAASGNFWAIAVLACWAMTIRPRAGVCAEKSATPSAVGRTGRSSRPED